MLAYSAGALSRRAAIARLRRSLNAALSNPELILSNLTQVVWLKDPKGVYLACNPFMGRLYGTSNESLIGRTDFDFLGIQQARDNRKADRAAIEAGETREQGGWQTFAADGHSAYMLVSRTPIYDEQGRLMGLLGVGRDITERYRAEKALRASEQLFRDFFEKHGVVMLSVDPSSGDINSANQAAADFYGYPRETLTGMPIDRINTSSKEKLARLRQQAIKGTRTCFEVQHRLASGELRDVEVYSVSIDTGGRAQLLSIVIDVTERTRSVQALTDERDLFSAGPVVVFTWKLEEGWPVEYVSANVANSLGYRKADIEHSGFRFSDLIHRDDLRRVGEEIECYLDRGVREFEQSYRLRRRDGQYRWYKDFTQAVTDDRGRAVALRGYLFDLSRTKELEELLANERLRQQFIIEGTRVGTWEWNIQTGETRFNEFWAGMIGYSLDELGPITIDTWLSIAHPDDLERSNRLLEEHFSGRRDYYDCEARMRHKDGSWVWVHDRGRVFEWTEDGKPLWMAGTHQDITERKRNEQALKDSERRLRKAGEAAYDLIYEWDPASDELRWFGDIDSALGYPQGTISADISQWIDRIHPDDRPMLQKAVQRHREDLAPFEYVYRIRRADGSYRYWEDKASPIIDGAGNPSQWIGACLDITERKLADGRKRLMTAVFTNAREGILIADDKAKIIDVNAAFTDITGYRREDVIGKNPNVLSSGRQDTAFYKAMWDSLLEHGHWNGELWNRRQDGTPYAENLSINAVHDEHGGIEHYVALFSDITQQKHSQDQLERIGYFDALTGLPNRVLLGDRLLQAMAQAKRHRLMLAVVYLDLDGFKEINDRFGHDIGDQILVDLAGRLKQVLRAEDTVSRLGGDEFVAVLVNLEDAASCVEMLPRMLAAAAQPVHLGDLEVALSGSVGVTFYPQPDTVDPDQLMRQADQAMYQAKLAGKNRYHIFDAEQDRSIRGRVEQLAEIQTAIEQDRFALLYQPKVNMRSGEVLGAEALIRWPQDDGSVRMPADFLPALENHKLAIALDEWVLDQALGQLAEWHAKGLKISVSVNVSACHLQQDDFIDRLMAVLARHPNADPGYLVVEILETTALMDLQRISAVVHAGQALGVTFALDDFGTGYSSLNYLKSLPARQLKIDRSFVRDMLDDRDDLAILEVIMGLASAFDRVPIAEGVESVAHGRILLQLGCEQAQGFGIGRPMPPRRFLDWAGSWQPDPVWQHQQRVPHEDLPVVFAMVEHRSWVKAIGDRVAGRHTRTPTMDERLCNFAKWMAQHGERRFRQRDAFREVRLLHHRVHELASRILALHAKGAATEAVAELNRLYELRDQLLEQMQSLLLQQQTGTC